MEALKSQLRDKMIVTELSKRYTCRICNEIFINTMVTNCGHRFCRYCAKLSLHNCPNCLECSEPLLSAKLDENTDRKIDSIFQRCSEMLQQTRKEIVEIRTASEKEMKDRFNVDATEEHCQTQISNSVNTSKVKSRGSDFYNNFARNSKILENKLFKTYDKLLTQISPSKSIHHVNPQPQPTGPKGDHCSDEDQAKIEHVAKMAAKTAAEAFQNLSHADDLLQEADDVLGIIDFLKTYSMDNIAKEAESFKTDFKTNEEQMDLEVNKGYENIQQILSSISSKKSQAKNKQGNGDTAESAISTRTLKNTNEYSNMDGIEFAAHMKKCKEALKRIRNENNTSVSNDNSCLSNASSNNKIASKCEIIRAMKWRDGKPSLTNNRVNARNNEAFKNIIKKFPAAKSSPNCNDSSQFKLPPLFSNENQEI